MIHGEGTSTVRLTRLSDRAAAEYARMWTDHVLQGVSDYAAVDPLTDVERQTYFETVCHQAYGEDEQLMMVCVSN